MTHNVYQFRLNGLDYRLGGDMAVDRLEQIVQLVEEKVQAVYGMAPQYSAVRATTLAALQLAEELIELREPLYPTPISGAEAERLTGATGTPASQGSNTHYLHQKKSRKK